MVSVYQHASTMGIAAGIECAACSLWFLGTDIKYNGSSGERFHTSLLMGWSEEATCYHSPHDVSTSLTQHGPY